MVTWRLWFLLVVLVNTSVATAASIDFGLFSDTPYTRWERENLPALIDEMNAEKLAFVVHGGDIKNSSGNCSNEYYQTVLGIFQRLQLPLIYVPGDNEWTDCFQGKVRFDPQERLQKLREIFMSGDDSLGARSLPLTRQSAGSKFSAYRENVRWELSGVLFVTLNIPGSYNNFYGITNGMGNPRGPSTEYLERRHANTAWLREAFAHAREKHLPGILLVIHANPGFEKRALPDLPLPGYAEFLEQLTDETLRFAGQVVLVHGDTHNQHIDQPMRDPKTGGVVSNFRRVENFGSPAFGWIRGTVDTGTPEVFKFSARRWEKSPIGQ